MFALVLVFAAVIVALSVVMVCAALAYARMSLRAQTEHAAELERAYTRSIVGDELVINALISDRTRLVTAVLARDDPRAAQALGTVDQAVANAVGGRRQSRDEMLRELMDREARTADEFTDSDGNPIMPVGLVSNG